MQLSKILETRFLRQKFAFKFPNILRIQITVGFGSPRHTLKTKQKIGQQRVNTNQSKPNKTFRFFSDTKMKIRLRFGSQESIWTFSHFINIAVYFLEKKHIML